MAIHPVVRQMVVCSDVEPDPGHPTRLNIRGYIHTIRVKPPGAFPALQPQLCVFLMLAGGVGSGKCRVVVTEADTGNVVLEAPDQEITFPSNRLHVGGVSFRFGQCVFPRPGLYWVEFHHEGTILRSEPLVLR